jgi:endonuclease/exonuclease/phosphatase family metal-dependent hydrolase
VEDVARSRSAAWLRVAAIALALVAAPSGAQESGLELSVLTYNVHGLPAWAARDDPEARLPRILERAGGYDVVLLQEDFAHQELTDRHARQPLQVRGVGRWRPWPGLQGSGLTLLSAFEEASRHAAAYGLCNGWLGAGNDCFANKGFLMLRLRLPSGAEVDFWNTHLDAGGSFGDHEARRAQLARLQREILSRSRGRAIVVGGDLNADQGTERERALVEDFVGVLGLSLGVVTPPGEWPELLDYILYRSGDGATLTALESGIAPDFVFPDGKPLSDHPALFTRFRVD